MVKFVIFPPKVDTLTPKRTQDIGYDAQKIVLGRAATDLVFLS